MGESNHGIVGYHNNTGDIRIDANNVGITTESTELYSGSFTLAQGICGRHRGTGDVDITARGGFRRTKCRSS